MKSCRLTLLACWLAALPAHADDTWAVSPPFLLDTLDPLNTTSAKSAVFTLNTLDPLGTTAGVSANFTLDTTSQSGLTGYGVSAFVLDTRPPTVAAPTSSGITSGTAILGGTVVDAGAAPVTSLGVVYAPTADNPNPRLGGTGVTSLPGTGTGGTFTVTASGLFPNTTYSFAAFAANTFGSGYSPTATFTTLPLPFGYIISNGAITLTGYTGPGGDVIIPGMIGNLPVTTIANGAFQNNATITSVFIPASVTSIGSGAFADCPALMTITVDPGNLTYSNSADGVLFDKLFNTLIQYPAGRSGYYAIPGTVTGIGVMAFTGCGGLTGVTLPGSIVSIGDEAFTSCTGLTAIYCFGDAPALGSSVFTGDTATVYYFPDTNGWGDPLYGCLTAVLLPYTIAIGEGGITIIGYTGNGGLVSIPPTIANLSVTAIGDYAFYFAGLTGVDIPAGVTSIGDAAFCGCAGLTGIALPPGLTMIGQYAFADTGLTGVMIPASVAGIGGGPFAGCFSLTSITVDAANQSFSGTGGILFDKNQTALIQYPSGKPGTSYAIPAGITMIGEAAFDGCYSLTSVTLPASVANIGDAAFSSCYKLKSATFHGNAPTMGAGVFAMTARGFTVNYYAGASGITAPVWVDSAGDSYPATMIAVSPVATWLAGHGLPPNTDLQSSANGDGVSLMMKYALNLDPATNQSANLPRTVCDGNQLRMTFYRGNTDVRYAVEASADLQNWSATGVTVSAPDGNGDCTATVPRSGGQRFLRLVVSCSGGL